MSPTPIRKALPRLDETLLAHLPPFSQLDKTELRSILDHAVPRRYDAGTHIFDQDFPAERFFILLDGLIRVLRLGQNGEQVIGMHIPPGQLFGIAKALGRSTYPATAVAAVECLALSWPTHLWDEFAATYEGFSTQTYKIVGERVMEMNTRIMEMATQHVEQRVANAVLRLIHQSGRKTPTGIEIDFPITRQDISEMTGTTLHTVSRLLSAWEKDGIIASKRKRIEVCDPHRLVMLSDATLL